MKFILPLVVAVLLSSQVAAQAATHYPIFSWDKVPVYQMFGDGERLLTDEESGHIATSTDFLCIEKNHACKMLGSADLGAKQEISRFKVLNSGMKCLFYFNSAYAYPFTTRSQVFRYGKVKKPYLSFLIRDSETGELSQRTRVHFFDVLNPDFRAWWAKTVGEYVCETGAEGLFVDQMHGFTYLRPERRDEVRIAQVKMMNMAKEAIGEDKILLLNNGANIPELFEIGDAFMFEHYSPKQLTKESIVADWELMKKISAAGKIAVWRIGIEVAEDHSARLTDAEYEIISKEKLPYHLAVFLMGAQPYSYFQYGWGWRLQNGALADYPELSKPLGRPLGEMIRIKSGDWVFERDFAHAHVRVDLESGKGTIQWR